jgi:hypothetical protein
MCVFGGEGEFAVCMYIPSTGSFVRLKFQRDVSEMRTATQDREMMDWALNSDGRNEKYLQNFGAEVSW